MEVRDGKMRGLYAASARPSDRRVVAVHETAVVPRLFAFFDRHVG